MAAAKASTAKPQPKSKPSRHPHGYTLDLLALAIDRLPPGFDAKRAKHYANKLAKFRKDTDAPFDEIQNTIIALGKESWPFRKAYEEMYRHYGRSSEESFLLLHLDAAVRRKFERFLAEGGKLQYLHTVRSIEELRQPTPFERYFSPVEKFAIERAANEANDLAHEEIRELVRGKKAAEYDTLVDAYRRRQEKMLAQIDELRNLTGVSEKWRAAIADRVRTIEEGWSVLEQGNDLADLLHETEYWKGTLQAFLHAR